MPWINLHIYSGKHLAEKYKDTERFLFELCLILPDVAHRGISELRDIHYNTDLISFLEEKEKEKEGASNLEAILKGMATHKALDENEDISKHVNYLVKTLKERISKEVNETEIDWVIGHILQEQDDKEFVKKLKVIRKEAFPYLPNICKPLSQYYKAGHNKVCKFLFGLRLYFKMTTFYLLDLDLLDNLDGIAAALFFFNKKGVKRYLNLVPIFGRHFTFEDYKDYRRHLEILEEEVIKIDKSIYKIECGKKAPDVKALPYFEVLIERFMSSYNPKELNIYNIKAF